MKKIMLIAFITFGMNVKAQITLENSYLNVVFKWH